MIFCVVMFSCKVRGSTSLSHKSTSNQVRRPKYRNQIRRAKNHLVPSYLLCYSAHPLVALSPYRPCISVPNSSAV